MSLMDDLGPIDKVTRSLQIVAGAMAAGVAIFLAIVVFVIPDRGAGGAGGPAGAPRLPALSVAAYTAAATLLPLSFVIPGVVAESRRKAIAAGKGAGAAGAKEDVAALAEAYQTRTILGLALNEAPAFLAAIAYMIERNTIALGLAIALLGVMVARIPTATRVSAWIDGQLDRLRSERSEARLG